VHGYLVGEVAILIHEVAHPDQYQPMWTEHCMHVRLLCNYKHGHAVIKGDKIFFLETADD